MKKIFESSDYLSHLHCDILEITLEEILDNPAKYQIVSILEDDEHIAIDGCMQHLPLSRIDIESMAIPKDGTVYYCKSGRRSSYLVDRIKEKYKDVEIYSLKKGMSS